MAKWIISTGLNPELLLPNDNNVVNTDKSSPKKSCLGVQKGTALSVDFNFEAKPLKLNEKEILDLLEKLIAIFPYSLNSNSLLTNITWEYVLTWKKETNELRPLEAAISTLKLIRCPHVRHGLYLMFKYFILDENKLILAEFRIVYIFVLGCCFLMWSSHLSSICESACRLVNKVSKLPKDRLCKQETGIAEENFNKFLCLWVQFIDIFIEVNSATETNLFH